MNKRIKLKDAEDRELMRLDLTKSSAEEKRKNSVTKARILDKLMGLNGDIDLNSKEVWDTILDKASRGWTINEIRGNLGITLDDWDHALKLYDGLRVTLEFAKIRFESYLQANARKRIEEGSDKILQFMMERCIEGYGQESKITVEGSTTLTVQTLAEYKASLLQNGSDE